MNNNLRNIAINMINSKRGNMPNAPWVGPAINAIMNNDAKAGEEIANNLCNSYGTTPQQAVEMAKQQMRINFPL